MSVKILFQGDSITDAGRDRRNYHNLGNGYPKYASKLIADAHPEIEFEFINLGISGNRTSQLSDRLHPDAIALQPDIISILIWLYCLFPSAYRDSRRRRCTSLVSRLLPISYRGCQGR